MVALAFAALATPAPAEEFPLTIEHKFGTTLIEEAPERVASIDFAGADDLLALDVQPVAIRHWYGDYARSAWPWAEPLLDGTPEILRGTLNFEQIAASDPDVIIALWSGITTEEYEKLSQIAPVVAVPEGVGDYALPWDERAILTGRAVGREEQARARVREIRARLEGVAAAHSDWQGKTASVAYAWEGDLGVYTSNDVRPQIMAELGFRTPEAVDAMIGENAFAVTLSEEALSMIDGDLILWIASDEDFRQIENLVARPFLVATQRGREVFIDKELAGAFGHASLLSLPYVIDRLIPMIEVALDGDPATHEDASRAAH